MTWCPGCPPVHRPRKQEYAHAHCAQSQRAPEMWSRVAGPSATVCRARHELLATIGVLLGPAPSRGPRRALLTGHVRVRARRCGFPLRFRAAQPRRFPRSHEQVGIVAGPWTGSSQQTGPSAPPAVGVNGGRDIRVGGRDRRRHDYDVSRLLNNTDDNSQCPPPNPQTKGIVRILALEVGSWELEIDGVASSASS